MTVTTSSESPAGRAATRELFVSLDTSTKASYMDVNTCESMESTTNSTPSSIIIFVIDLM